jgi:hypothetical protein
VQVKARPSRGYTEEEEVYRRAQKAKHAVLNGQISDGARALVQPGLLKWSQHIIEQMESIHKVGEEHVDMPVPADGWASVEANDERYGYTASTMEVKMQSGQTKEEPTLPYLLRHLPKYKAPGCVGDRYEHYQAMPFAFVDVLVHDALNSQVTDGFASIWRAGLLHPGDKQKKDAQGRPVARPIVVGLAARRITGRVPVAEMKHFFAKLFAQLRQLGCAIPAGVEIAYHTTVLVCDHLEALADGDDAEMPSPIQIDFENGFNNINRAALQEAVEEHCPQLLRYNTLCYHGLGNLYAIEGGKVVATIQCNHGVWQGDSIGSHKYCLGMIKFFQKLASELRPHTTFDHQSAGVPFSAIIDDVTLVPRRRHVLSVLDFILQEAPRHGQVPNLNKTAIWLRKGSLDSELAQELLQRGVKVSVHGLDRLLGAPVGGTDWLVSPNGHLAHITAQAIQLTERISTIKHPQCEYLLLRYCSSNSLHHIGRLISPRLAQGFASQHHEAVLEGARRVLLAETLSPIQQARLTLPEYEGGGALTTAKQVLNGAFLGSAGATARWLNGKLWPEAEAYLKIIASHKEYRNVANIVEQQFEAYEATAQAGTTRPPYRFPDIDLQTPTSLPTQKQISRALHRITAADLMQDLVNSAPVAASWHISCSLPGSGSWLHTMPYVNRVSAKTWRTMFCLRMMAPIPEATGIDRCVPGCSCTGWQLQLGFHWMSGCEKLSYNTVRHNAVAAVLRKLFKKIGWETRFKEQAGWVVGAPDLRPYDVPARPNSSTPWMGIDVAVADPSRHGYLSSGQRYFKKAAAAARYVHKKQTKYNRLLTRHSIRYLVNYTPLGFEVTGGFSKKVCSLLSDLLESEEAAKATLSATEWSWSAMGLPAYFQQAISFEIVRMTALSVQNGIRRAQAAAISRPAGSDSD